MGKFDIEGELGRPRLMKDGNESLLTMGMQNNFMETHITEESILVTDKTEIFTFATDIPHENEKIKDMLAKH